MHSESFKFCTNVKSFLTKAIKHTAGLNYSETFACAAMYVSFSNISCDAIAFITLATKLILLAGFEIIKHYLVTTNAFML